MDALLNSSRSKNRRIKNKFKINSKHSGYGTKFHIDISEFFNVIIRQFHNINSFVDTVTSNLKHFRSSIIYSRCNSKRKCGRHFHLIYVS